jgi:hypothetical protein
VSHSLVFRAIRDILRRSLGSFPSDTDTTTSRGTEPLDPGSLNTTSVSVGPPPKAIPAVHITEEPTAEVLGRIWGGISSLLNMLASSRSPYHPASPRGAEATLKPADYSEGGSAGPPQPAKSTPLHQSHANGAIAAPTTQPVPHIFRITPLSGPIIGGIEVSVLGSGFSFHNACTFGGSIATTIWETETARLCILPPSQIPEQVAVSFRDVPVMGTTQTFTYVDTRENDACARSHLC